MKILMSDGTSASARQVLCALAPHHTIDICAPSPLCQCRFSKLTRRWLRSPRLGSQPAEFLRFIYGAVATGDYDVLLPTHEELYLLAKYQHVLGEQVGLAAPPLASMQRMLGKVAFVRTMNELGLPIPEALILTTDDELAAYDRFPFFLKLNYATAGLGVRRIENAGELTQALSDFRNIAPNEMPLELVAQQPAHGVMCTVQALFQHGQYLGCHCAEVLEPARGGAALLRESVRHPIVAEQMQHLGEALHWHGAMFLEYFYDKEQQQPWYIECNPRIGEPINAQLSGVDLVGTLLEISAGREASPLPESRTGVRSHVGYIRLIHHALEGATRGALWREWKQMRGGRGVYAEAANELVRPGDLWGRAPGLFIAARLLASPHSALAIVEETVGNYALTAEAIREIDQMPDDLLD